MIDHLSIAVSNVAKARSFYDAALAPLRATRLTNFDRDDASVSGYGRDGKPSFWIGERRDSPATPMPGHIAFAAENRGQVDAFYRAAIAAGASDNGAPGLRPHYHANYYAAFVIDPDGHRLEAVCHAPA
jgi:catechol 2,3-dioxygenase-like lactoylglutathione lyase family enzyme